MVLEEETGSYESANGGGVPIPHEYRRSIDQYYQRDLETDPLDLPPSYDALIPPPSWRRRFNVQPREDEGREALPAYSSYISLESIFEKKMELEGAVHKAQDRNWYKVWVTLQGTALTFHKCKSEGFFHRSEGGRKPNADIPAGQKQMSFIRSYNLQHADVGIASDYTKKRYVIRVRAEADQFLLSCTKIETLVLWLQSLFAAIDLAFPLDDRQIPRDFSIPRARRRLARAGFGAIGDMERNTELIREQEDILRTQFPRLAGQIEEEPEDHSTDSEQSSRPDTSPAPSPARSTASSTRPTGLRAPRFISRARQAIQPIANLTTFQPNIPNPSITSEGKWRPDHQWTHFYDMMYARRCMAVLTERSPRKSNLVIMKGKQWVVDWSTGTLTRCQPPGYEEVTSGAEMEKLTELHSGSGSAGPSRVRV